VSETDWLTNTEVNVYSRSYMVIIMRTLLPSYEALPRGLLIGNDLVGLRILFRHRRVAPPKYL
jgi:predicted thioesterase